MGDRKKTFSRESDENLGGGEPIEDIKNEETVMKDSGEMRNVDLNNANEQVFQFGAVFLEKQTEEHLHRDGEGIGSASKRRYSAEEKGKGKAQIDVNRRIPDIDEAAQDLITLMNVRPTVERDVTEISESDSELSEEEDPQIIFVPKFDQGLWRIREKIRLRKQRKKIAEENARRLAYPEEYPFKPIKKATSEVVDEVFLQDLRTIFQKAMEVINQRKLKGFKWVPDKGKGLYILRYPVPSLLDLSLTGLAKNAEAIVSLECVPNVLRHKLSQVVCDYKKMDHHFLELLASGSPTEIRVKDCSGIKIDDFTKIFGACNREHLTVLQLDLCGRSLSDDVLHDTLARSFNSLPALAAISLDGAYRLTDIGLKILAASAPALKSVNISQCSLLTSSGIIALVSCLQSTLRELYIDYCESADAMVMLPALKKLEFLEVLSVAGIETVTDGFVCGIIEAHGDNLKELVFADCVKLTDRAIRFMGVTCSRLCALDLSNLHNLTDSTMQYLANGCRTVHRLKLCRNNFSDEAIATFLEVAGDSISELLLNNISRVGLNTALSLATRSRNLLSLDLSWCRNLTDEALGFIVDNCLSLRLLKLFGCTQITDVLLYGHSNPGVRIIGLKLTPILEHPNVVEPQQSPLRYSPLTFPVDQQIDSPR